MADDVNLEEFVTAKDDLSGADIKVSLLLLGVVVLCFVGC